MEGEGIKKHNLVPRNPELKKAVEAWNRLTRWQKGWLTRRARPLLLSGLNLFVQEFLERKGMEMREIRCLFCGQGNQSRLAAIVHNRTTHAYADVGLSQLDSLKLLKKTQEYKPQEFEVETN